MRIKGLLRVASLGLIAAMAGASGAAQSSLPLRLSGIINDYSSGGGGPWHLAAEWELHVKGQSDKADFTAAVAMQRSDLWVVQNLATVDPADTDARMPHTHHVSLVDGVVTTQANGIRITGTATVTGSGNPAFTAAVQIDITGGSAVAFSNIKVTFGAPASNHFGTQGLDGVVVRN